ncbi:MAG: hypothetical protein QMB38_07605 [Ascidiaceihabitans sp.]|jgi:hypothetical protein|tara:strand:- start:494 stop:994 length:501 start_codon:yes stop_codon:yes gene_type:complete
MFSDGSDPAGNLKVGFHAFGSEHITGHHVLVEATALLLDNVRNAVNKFIYSISLSNTLPQDGHIVELKSGGRLRVSRNASDKRFPRAYLSVEVLDVRSAPMGTKGPSPKPERPLATKRLKVAQELFQTHTGQLVCGVASVLIFGGPFGLITFSAWFIRCNFKPKVQ